ncbi:MAG: hypothetical protein ACJAQS_000387 [Porticoccus sp.]|jgi:hypothetical protein
MELNEFDLVLLSVMLIPLYPLLLLASTWRLFFASQFSQGYAATKALIEIPAAE